MVQRLGVKLLYPDFRPTAAVRHDRPIEGLEGLKYSPQEYPQCLSLVSKDWDQRTAHAVDVLADHPQVDKSTCNISWARNRILPRQSICSPIFGNLNDPVNQEQIQ